ncbi:MAG: signal peptidase I [Bacteroidetes bacterium]|nr:signal peptidase I [Bacteroidota bacterium]
MFFKKKEKKKYDSKLAEWLDAIIFALVVAGFIRIFFMQAYRIPTESMESTQLAGDFLFVNNFIYGAKIPFTDLRVPGLRMPEKGDIVVFVYPKDTDLDYIKRCVGVAGDTIQVKNKQLFVNGVPFENPPKSQFGPDTLQAGIRYFGMETFPSDRNWNRDNYGPIYIPRKGDVIPMNAQTFSLYQDCIIHETEVKPRLVDDNVYLNGKILSSYTIQQDYFWMMGDNRDNSADSRYWGFVPESHVRGKALITYWSWDQKISFANPIDLLASIRWSRIGRLIE